MYLAIENENIVCGNLEFLKCNYYTINFQFWNCNGIILLIGQHQWITEKIERRSNGEKKLIHSGSYGIGVSRLVAAIIEANNDEKGIIWPKKVSPYSIGLINVRNDNDVSKSYSEDFYEKFSHKYEIIYDDRDVRAGEKFNDMDLIGIPLQVIIGEKNLSNSNIEVKHRNTGKSELISLDKIKSYLEEKCEF